MIVYLNGRFLKEEEAKIPATDRGFLFGDGIFTSILVRGGKVEFLESHLERLNEHLLALGIDPPIIDPKTIKELVQKNKAIKSRWRLRITISGGKAARRLAPRSFGQILITISPFIESFPETYRLCIYPTPVVSPLSGLKTLSYFDRFWIKHIALKKGFDECLVRDFEGNILEASFANLFWIKNEKFYFPNKNLPYLFGITLTEIIEVAKELKFSIQEGEYQLSDLESASVFLCSSTHGFIPVIEIEKFDFTIEKYSRDVGFEKKLKKAFQERISLKSFSCI